MDRQYLLRILLLTMLTNMCGIHAGQQLPSTQKNIKYRFGPSHFTFGSSLKQLATTQPQQPTSNKNMRKYFKSLNKKQNQRLTQ